MQDICDYRISVKGVVFDKDGRFLLAKEENGFWELLGGGLEHGEDPIECLKREIHEETGLTVTFVSPKPQYFITSPKKSNASWIANIVYEIKLDNYNFIASDECTELRFFSAQEAKKVNLFPNVIKFIEQLQ